MKGLLKNGKSIELDVKVVRVRIFQRESLFLFILLYALCPLPSATFQSMPAFLSISRN